jgi:hypothetical protein
MLVNAREHAAHVAHVNTITNKIEVELGGLSALMLDRVHQHVQGLALTQNTTVRRR